MVYQFRLDANRIDSNTTRKLEIPKILEYLNNGMLQLCVTRYGSNNTYRASLESIQKRIDEWQKLIVPHYKIDANEDEDNAGLYRSDLPLKDGYMFLLRCSFIASKNDCNNQLITNVHLIQTDDLNFNFDNPNSKSNFEWREVNYRLAQDQILAYTDSTFSINKTEIDFLRYPLPMDMIGYTRFDGTPGSDTDCELPVFLHREVVNEAVLLYKVALGQDPAAALAKKQMEE